MSGSSILFSATEGRRLCHRSGPEWTGGHSAGYEGEFQAIILDLGLPDLNGRQVCERLRSTGVDTPILMLTARDAVQDKVSGLRSGADDYMTKPFAFEELLARIEALMRRRGGEIKTETKEFRIADLVLNGETHEVKRGETLIDLTPKEFALLECFMRMPGKVLSRTASWNKSGATAPIH